jgi:uncharacterized repeat protein (TIGR01451 family)
MDRFLETTMRRPRRSKLLAAAMGLLVVLALSALAPAAFASTAETAAVVRAERQAANRAATLQAREERAARALQVAAERRRAAAERRAAAVARKRRTTSTITPVRASTEPRMTPFGTAEISCTSVTFHFKGFPATGVNRVTEWVYIEGDPMPPFVFTFTGETASNTLTLNPEEVRKGRKRIDALATGRNSDDATFKGGFDIVSSQECGNVNEPAFAIEKTQTIAGGHSGFHEAPIVAEVGQTIEYQIKVTNTGNTVITFATPTDPNCEGLHGGAPGGILEPSGFERFYCTHTLTAADLAAGSYSNVATIVGTPNGIPAKEETSNTVVAQVVPVGSGPGGGKGGSGGGGSGGTNGGSNGSGTANGGNGGALGSTSSSTGTGTGGPREGTLGATSASVPLLSAAPAGCVRSSFLVRVRSRGVRSVVFYVDGHRLKVLTARAAKHGYFTVRVNVAKLRVGRHRLQVRITMQAVGASRHHIAATRSLSFLRCASAAVHPHFTG